MQDFKTYLLSMHIAGPKAVGFCVHWVTRCYRYTGKNAADAVTEEEKEAYLRHLAKTRESWQAEQAAKAIGLYQFYRNRKTGGTDRMQKPFGEASVEGGRR